MLTRNPRTAYGEWYWFRFPVFLVHKPKQIDFNQEYIHKFLENNEPWDETLFASSQMAKKDFLEHTKEVEFGNGHRVIDYGTGSHGKYRLWEGEDALKALQRGVPTTPTPTKSCNR